jgi:xylan 1,4-beta-xylosidase
MDCESRRKNKRVDWWRTPMKPLSLLALAAALSAGPLFAQTPASAPLAVTINVDAGRSLGPLKPIWRYFGADEPNYATMKDGQRLLSDLGALSPGQIYFRAHNLLSTGDGTAAFKWGSTNAYTEDAQGKPIYDWRIVDGIFDSYLARGVKPLVQIGFMPQALSTQPEPYRHNWKPTAGGLPLFTGWTRPPKDYAKWGELSYQWAAHNRDKYGANEVATWWWEVWNEPNIGYWSGTPEEFRKLHDYAIAGVRRAIPNARVGGPDTAGGGGQFLKDFLEHCLHGTNYATGEKGTPLDFVAFHAKGSPTTQNGFVRMGIAAQLKTIENTFATIASYPELKDIPVILGESDPEGCAACQGPQLAYRNGTMYSSYTAAVFARKHDLAALHHINLEGAVTWAFTFEDQAWFAGFRQIATNGVPMAVFNVFRMYALMGPERVATTSSGAVPLTEMIDKGVRGAPDVSALATRDARKIAIMVWNYHDDDVPGPSAAIALSVAGLPADLTSARFSHYRIDKKHSNPYGEWLLMADGVAGLSESRPVRRAPKSQRTRAPRGNTEHRGRERRHRAARVYPAAAGCVVASAGMVGRLVPTVGQKNS